MNEEEAMRTPVEPGATVDDVPSRRGAPPLPSRKSDATEKRTIRAAETTRPTAKDQVLAYENKNSGANKT